MLLPPRVNLLQLAAGLCAIWTSSAQTCVFNTVNDVAPAPGVGVELQGYSYCGKFSVLLCRTVACICFGLGVKYGRVSGTTDT